MCRRKTIIMLLVILILQIVLPATSMIIESAITLKSIAYDGEEYYINTAQDLWDFAEEVNSGDTFEGVTVYLTADIHLECDEENHWIPIGDYNTDTSYKFAGIFDGQGNKITGIYINSDKKYQGLFGFNEGTIKNICIDDGTIINTGSSSGSIVGYNSGEIIDCINNIAITGGDNFGGICGRNYGDIISCSNNATITGVKEVTGKQLGGVCGFNGGNIIDSLNTGTIIGNEEDTLSTGIGGIVGYNEGKVEMCTNSANISNKANVGGIAGYNYNSIINCTNTGNVTGTYWLGGIVGDNEYRSHSDGYATIYNCSNSGNIKSTLTLGTSYAGGIAGSSSCSVEEGVVTITKCYNTGTIEGSAYVGRSMWIRWRWKWRRYYLYKTMF